MRGLAPEAPGAAPQNELVLPLKDPTSDMAVIARNGSKLVKEIRDKKEASKSRARFWEVAGSKMGQITGALNALPPPLPPPDACYKERFPRQVGTWPCTNWL